jgi:hypothetical protein
MNLHLSLVVSDLVGETGLRIIQAMVQGQRDPKELVKLAMGAATRAVWRRWKPP